MQPVVYRCDFCGAPLTLSSTGVTACRFCGEQNVLAPDHSRLLRHAREARALVAELGERTAALEREWRALLDDITAGQRGLVPRFLELHEGWLRLTYAPTLHFVRGLEPDDPVARQALAEVDATVARVLARWRASLPAG